MINEVIVVEGEHDRQAVARAVEADCVVTGGHALTPELLARLKLLQQRRGLIILTDPDYTGEQIRRKLSRHISGVKHAYLPRGQALAAGDIGVENATPQAIREALSRLHSEHDVGTEAKINSAPKNTAEFSPISWSEFLQLDLTGLPDSAERRRKLGDALGLGSCNSRQLFQRLNNYRITREEIAEAMEMQMTNYK